MDLLIRTERKAFIILLHIVQLRRAHWQELMSTGRASAYKLNSVRNRPTTITVYLIDVNHLRENLRHGKFGERERERERVAIYIPS